MLVFTKLARAPTDSPATAASDDGMRRTSVDPAGANGVIAPDGRIGDTGPPPA